jgi:hypothetical protein
MEFLVRKVYLMLKPLWRTCSTWCKMRPRKLSSAHPAHHQLTIMDETHQTPEQHNPQPSDLHFGEEMILEEAGFAFQPILGFELEVDGSVYMYSDDGNLEISLIGGELENEVSIAELNDALAADFMANFDEFQLSEAGKGDIRGITGFLIKIHFMNAEEEGQGQVLICSPHTNQFFFLLVISSADQWDQLGQPVFAALKKHIHFHPIFKPAIHTSETEDHPDLTIETYQTISPNEELIIAIERGDVSVLMAARTATTNDEITITQITEPNGQTLYRFDPLSGDFDSCISDQPLVSSHGEICLTLPCGSQQTLQPGSYRLAFTTSSGLPLHEVQIIIRQSRVLQQQKVDFNFWIALEDERFNRPDFLSQFEADLRHALADQLVPMNLAPGTWPIAAI